MAYLIIFVGAGIGGMLRQFVNVTIGGMLGPQFPYGTMVINIVGSALMGVFVGWFAFRGNGVDQIRLFVATGILGGFTTFSSFSLDAVSLYERGEVLAAGTYVLVSVIVSLLALFAALAVMREILA